ncbi:MAG: flagellar filament capping protein FliD [Phycisphaerales bacterium]
MSGVTSSVGVFSGIDREQIISQLLNAASRPKTLIQRRVVQLQTQSTSLLDISSRLGTLKAAAAKFNTSRVFEQVQATTSDDKVATATAAPGAAAGTYSFVVDRLVSTHQVLSRGFSAPTGVSVGATSFTFEPAQGRLDTQTRLSDLNGGAGITRGKIVITDSGGTATTVDLSKVESVDEVVKAINDAAQGRVVASVFGDKLRVLDQGGGVGSLAITDAPGTTGTTASLGLTNGPTDPGDGGEIIGGEIYKLGRSVALRTLNDGNGVNFSKTIGTSSPDIKITTRDGTVIEVDLGDVYENIVPPVGGAAVPTLTKHAASDIGEVIDRINAAAAGKVVAGISTTGPGLVLSDTTAGAGSLVVEDLTTGTTAKDLGLLGTSALGQIDGRKLLASINSTLSYNLNGGAGVASGAFTVTGRDGTVRSFTVNTGGSVQDLINSFGDASAYLVTAELDKSGTGILLKDNTGGGGAFIVSGAGATALGLATAPAGVGASTVQSARLQHKYVSTATRLDSLNGGRGIGIGDFQIVDSYGKTSTVRVTTSQSTVGDLISQINSSGGGNIGARINDKGDGILLYEIAAPGGAGVRAISVKDTTGGVAKALNILSTAAGTGAQNIIDGSAERTVTFAAADSLQQIADKINQAGVQVTAAVINDGSSSTPSRLTFTSRGTGEAGRFSVDTGSLDLGLTTLSEGLNSRVLFGSTDPARAILLSSSTNAVSGVVAGLTLDLRSAAPAPVSISIASDTTGIVASVNEFITAFNELVDRIDGLTSFDSTTNQRGPLLGDSTASSLRGELNSVLNSQPKAVGGRFQFLSQVGVAFDKDGRLTLNEERLRTSIQTDAQAVRDLFAAKGQAQASTTERVFADNPGILVRVSTSGALTTLGVAERLVQSIEKYTKAVDGIIPRRTKTIDEQVRTSNTRISQLDLRLASRRAILENQFIAMESAIGRLQTQSGSLQNIRAITLT